MTTATADKNRPLSSGISVGRAARSIFGFFKENTLFTSGVVLLLALLLFGVLGARTISPKMADMGAATLNLAPSPEHRLGTDGLGRDMFAVMVIGIPNTFRIGFLAGAVGVIIGALLGMISGYYRGYADVIFSSFADVMLVIPTLAILITVSAYVRVVTGRDHGYDRRGCSPGPCGALPDRAQTLSLLERLFVAESPASRRQNDLEIILIQILPNLTAYRNAASFVGAVSSGILAAVGLEVLGLGPQNVPTIGHYALLCLSLLGAAQGDVVVVGTAYCHAGHHLHRIL
ncbi:MAG: hypothetical protein R2856_22395 [Caldilineaceae bacterium]